MTSHPQLTLPVSGSAEMRLDNFHGPHSDRIIDNLKRAILHTEGEFVYLAGPGESGKTHLISALISELELSKSPLRHVYVPCDQIPLTADFIESLATFEVVFLDDVDRWFTGEISETLFFNLYNMSKDAGKSVVMSSSFIPSDLPVNLPDLRSRLGAPLLIRLSPLADSDKLKIITSIAADKGFDLGAEVAEYILKRSHRTMEQLVSLLDQLDKASLSEQRKLTIPFVKKVLGW